MHRELYEAIIDVGQNRIFELQNEIYPYLYEVYPGFREEAVIALGWTTSLAIPEFCKSAAYQIWLEDSDDDVRVAALVAWSWYYISVKNPKYLCDLLAILKDDGLSIRIKVHALKRIYDACNLFENAEQIYAIFSCLNIENNEEFIEKIDLVNIEVIVNHRIELWKNIENTHH